MFWCVNKIYLIYIFKLKPGDLRSQPVDLFGHRCFTQYNTEKKRKMKTHRFSSNKH